jgi:hypothetical protein
LLANRKTASSANDGLSKGISTVVAAVQSCFKTPDLERSATATYRRPMARLETQRRGDLKGAISTTVAFVVANSRQASRQVKAAVEQRSSPA